MNEKNNFLNASFDNLDDMFKMLSYLNNKVTSNIIDDYSSVVSSRTSYSDFICEKTISQEGRDWKSVFDEFSNMFERCVIWQSPSAMINITPPSNIPSVAASCYSMMFNPNFATDESAGFLMSTEINAIRYLLQLVGWSNKSSGIFTFGGTGTNLYALRLGIKNANPNCIVEGINAKEYVIFTNEKSHPCHIDVAIWMGIPQKNIVVLPVNDNGTVNTKILYDKLCECVSNGKKIACIYLNGGTTNEGYIDPVKEVVEIRNNIVKKYNLHYSPYIHVDAVIGWSWLFFKKYDFKNNPLNMNEIEIKKIKKNVNSIKELKFADSFGADFHKTGFCPYVSSAFVVKNRKRLEQGWHCNYSDKSLMSHGEYTPFEFSLELTRSSIGPVSAYISLEIFGIEGYQKLMYNLFHSGEVVRRMIANNDDFILLNPDTCGLSTMFLVKNDKCLNGCNLLEMKIDDLIELINYNYSFFNFVKEKNRQGLLNPLITYSKSFKLNNIKFGALKIFQMSPIVDDDKWKGLINELFETKKEFDSKNIQYFDKNKSAKDLTYNN